MGLTLEMATRDDFKPEHDEYYITFLVSDFYNDVEYKELRCEFYYSMICAETGYPVPCSMCYSPNDFPFDVPLLFDKDNKPYALSRGEMEDREFHDDPEQRFWWTKTWMLTSNNTCIHPEELDEISVGIMKTSDFVGSVRQANKFRLEVKEANRRQR